MIGEARFPSRKTSGAAHAATKRTSRMARMSPAEKIELLRQALGAWERLRPNRSYSGITLQHFRQMVQACIDARAEVDDARFRLRDALTKRDHSDFHAIRLRKRLG